MDNNKIYSLIAEANDSIENIRDLIDKLKVGERLSHNLMQGKKEITLLVDRSLYGYSLAAFNIENDVLIDHAYYGGDLGADESAFWGWAMSNGFSKLYRSINNLGIGENERYIIDNDNLRFVLRVIRVEYGFCIAAVKPYLSQYIAHERYNESDGPRQSIVWAWAVLNSLVKGNGCDVPVAEL